MKNNNLYMVVTILILSVCNTQRVEANGGNTKRITEVLKSGEVGLNLRYRTEYVEQDNLYEDAVASTLRTRINWRSGSFQGANFFLELDNVSEIGVDKYNSTVNGKTEYPVVADPKGTEINQVYLRYNLEQLKVTVGNQRINLNNPRFVGGMEGKASWRQNERTYDGIRYQYGNPGQLQLDHSYIYNINRVYGEDSNFSDFKGDIHLFRASYPVLIKHQLSVFLYNLDFDNAINDSSRTYGMDYLGNFGAFETRLSFAHQKNINKNLNDYSANYYLAEITGTLGKMKGKIGYEILGANNGIGFSTPLATIHKFQGFTDKFRKTPAKGVEDLYVTANLKLIGGNLGISYHNFEANQGSAFYGSEWSVRYNRKFSKHLSGMVKYATYNAKDYLSDTNKFWLMITMNF
ncbi:hypothetical protein [Microbulbifer sp. DLAB2-AA]|uniref:hypothetical protein n=1 Tax=Microbulbifer sp. DLAB2-AA TaxID=3243394 RepID=UPI00403A67CE